MRSALVFLFAVVLSSAVGQTVVDFYLDMEGGTNGETLTTNLLNACTHLAPGAGYWTFNRGHPKGCTDCWEELASVTDFKVLSTAGTNGVWQLRSPVSVNGVTYDNAIHTRVFGKGLSNRNQGAQFNFTTPHLRISVGYYYTLAVGYINQTIGEILSTSLYNYSNESNWEFDIAAGYVINANAIISAHSQAGWYQQAGSIPIAKTKSYWVTQLWDGLNGVSKVEVYDPLTWAKIGITSQLVLSNLPCQHFQFGDLMNTNTGFGYGSYPVTNCFGNIIMDWTTARFPLLLPAPPFTNLIISWTPSNSATLQYSTNGNTFAWQTYSNNVRPPVTIPRNQLLPQEVFRVSSSNSTRVSIKKQ
jgi:hypothetical protein